ncbi:hypothetical protein [Virgibacillus ndiopensis]|uniref:hypothetical protein n=1 Tax=Virgibacillus ndiopensis TaxID=2004408 RepID=UPI000C068E28|nr:hypothetical protein [Virgibacillus ndiopensis]
MNRSFERKVMYVASGWQLFTGLITIFFYSFYIKSQGSDMEQLSFFQMKGVQEIFDTLYMFSITYGLLFVVIAILNIIFVKRMVKDNTVHYKLPVYWVILAVVFFFLSDFISVALCLVAAVIALAKNKPIKKSASARVATCGLRPAKQGGSVLPRKAAVLIEHSSAGDKGNSGE